MWTKYIEISYNESFGFLKTVSLRQLTVILTSNKPFIGKKWTNKQYHTHVVILLLWSMKKTRPFWAICIAHPAGKGFSLGTTACKRASSGVSPELGSGAGSGVDSGDSWGADGSVDNDVNLKQKIHSSWLISWSCSMGWLYRERKTYLTTHSLF